MAIVPTHYLPEANNIEELLRAYDALRQNGPPLDPGTASTDAAIFWDDDLKCIKVDVTGATGGLEGTPPVWVITGTTANVVQRVGTDSQNAGSGSNHLLVYTLNAFGAGQNWNAVPTAYQQAHVANLAFQVAEILWSLRRLIQDLKDRGVVD